MRVADAVDRSGRWHGLMVFMGKFQWIDSLVRRILAVSCDDSFWSLGGADCVKCVAAGDWL